MTGRSGASPPSAFSGLIGSLPTVHELASQAGIELPGALGKVARNEAGGGIKNAP